MQSMNVETRKSYRAAPCSTGLEAGPLRIPVELCIPIGVEGASAGPIDYFCTCVDLRKMFEMTL